MGRQTHGQDTVEYIAHEPSPFPHSSLNSLTAVTAIVPATTANLGPGFDCLGAALALYNQVRFTRLATDGPPLTIAVSGDGADRVPRDDSNLVYQAYCALFKHIGKPPLPVHLDISLGVPLARGLGSSATAIAAGLVGANFLMGNPLSPNQLSDLAITLEGHPDNIIPALFGSCRLSATRGEGAWVHAEVPWKPDITPVVAIPNFELSTSEARQVLPPHYSRDDAVFNTAHLGLLLRGLEEGRIDWLQAAMQDRIHQPYRTQLIPGFEAVRAAAIAAGACETVISGAGPTLLALATQEAAPAVAAAMQQGWQDQGIEAIAKPIALDLQGTRLRP